MYITMVILVDHIHTYIHIHPSIHVASMYTSVNMIIHIHVPDETNNVDSMVAFSV